MGEPGRTKKGHKVRRVRGAGGGIDDRDRNRAKPRAERGLGSESLWARVGSRWLSWRDARVVALGCGLSRGATEN